VTPAEREADDVLREEVSALADLFASVIQSRDRHALHHVIQSIRDIPETPRDDAPRSLSQEWLATVKNIKKAAEAWSRFEDNIERMESHV
jgi:hypothetical protein